ncbi:MAG: S8 family serine peptidase [Actinophytocola sp.]|uniref:S8 family peptidase n=1 Tax=Actinophytocola sp. TaxID=1872138 RepID=UPI001329EA67|nr:S8 family serine peptidase [Actinophytocola sp.]MPZ80306.1 S8 family serine peptidase [Actinophytocola sp.]
MTSASSNGGAGTPDRPSDRGTRFPEVISLAPGTLARHRARLLEPSTAVRAHDGTWPLPTAYRADSLLLPVREAQTLLPEEPNDYNTALEGLGVELRPPDNGGWREHLSRLHPDLPVPVPLLTRGDTVTDRPPDPWAALVRLRRAFGSDARGAKIGLNHLVASASVTVEGAPVNHGGNVDGAPVNHGGGVGGDGRVALYTGSRNPVAMVGRPPVRRPAAELVGGRRPVIAVLDTGIGEHDWLTVGPLSADPVVEVSQDFQTALAAHEPAFGSPHPLASPDDQADEIQPLLGITDSHFGHGTFVTGLIHQMCPDARVLSLRVLQSDGFSTEGSVLFALDWLRRRVVDAIANGTPDELVDVVSLSLGFYPETAQPGEVAQVADAIERLTDLGVLVVAAAGNDATMRPFLPAAFGQDAAGTTGNPLLAAVGALNASGFTTAAFSNHGPWVWRWAPGNALISTVPKWEGSAFPGLGKLDGGGVGPRWRTAPDPDDLRTGFAVWAGTSFATPVVAGLVAESLATDPETGTSFDAERARRALKLTDLRLTDRGWR